jgi:hypothetical protein
MQTLRPSTGYALSCSRTNADTRSGERTSSASPIDAACEISVLLIASL